jgi:hypothetical protein
MVPAKLEKNQEIQATSVVQQHDTRNRTVFVNLEASQWDKFLKTTHDKFLKTRHDM